MVNDLITCFERGYEKTQITGIGSLIVTFYGKYGKVVLSAASLNIFLDVNA